MMARVFFFFSFFTLFHLGLTFFGLEFSFKQEDTVKNHGGQKEDFHSNRIEA